MPDDLDETGRPRALTVRFPARTFERMAVAAAVTAPKMRPAPVAHLPAASYSDENRHTRTGNGVHTIAWSATDNMGHADGIGSRYFWVQN